MVVMEVMELVVMEVVEVVSMLSWSEQTVPADCLSLCHCSTGSQPVCSAREMWLQSSPDFPDQFYFSSNFCLK